MTRKDYIVIAEALRVHYHLAKISQDGHKMVCTGEVAEELADTLHRDNPRFDREFFLQVVRGEKPLNARPPRRSRERELQSRPKRAGGAI